MKHTVHAPRIGLYCATLVIAASLPLASNALPRKIPSGFDFNNNAVLINFLMKSDVIWSRVLTSCTNLNIARHNSNGHQMFDIKGFCHIKGNPQEDLDCPGYNVDASGEIDNNVQATIRKFKLSLVCTA